VFPLTTSWCPFATSAISMSSFITLQMFTAVEEERNPPSSLADYLLSAAGWAKV
jgi:hypothetical protein